MSMPFIQPVVAQTPPLYTLGVWSWPRSRGCIGGIRACLGMATEKHQVICWNWKYMHVLRAAIPGTRMVMSKCIISTRVRVYCIHTCTCTRQALSLMRGLVITNIRPLNSGKHVIVCQNRAVTGPVLAHWWHVYSDAPTGMNTPSCWLQMPGCQTCARPSATTRWLEHDIGVSRNIYNHWISNGCKLCSRKVRDPVCQRSRVYVESDVTHRGRD